MTGHPVRLLLAALGAAALLLAAGCGTEQPAPMSGAQESAPPPVLTHTNDPSAPVTLRLVSGSAPIQTVDTDDNGVLLPPKDIAQLGWWIGSARPGSGAGTVVITGHVDDVEQGTGFAQRFSSLTPGAIIEVTTADQQTRSYRVSSVDAVTKEGGLPVDELNRLDGPETLALVTCGGPFVGPPLGYRDNIVVLALPT
ncbi:MAG: class F sortase [Gordonia sp. (in: high G+C Gram-positive bacteria)]